MIGDDEDIDMGEACRHGVPWDEPCDACEDEDDLFDEDERHRLDDEDAEFDDEDDDDDDAD
jgi:hypothetical protein